MVNPPQGITIRQFCADYHEIDPADVTWDHMDPVVYFMRDNFPKGTPGDRTKWILDDAAQQAVRDHLDGDEVELEDDVPSDPWDEFLEWARRFREWPGFDQDERDYKLVVINRINEARAAVIEEASDWHTLLKRCFGPPSCDNRGRCPWRDGVIG